MTKLFLQECQTPVTRWTGTPSCVFWERRLLDSKNEIPQTFLSNTSKHGKNETQPACKHVVSVGSSHTGHAEVARQETGAGAEMNRYQPDTHGDECD